MISEISRYFNVYSVRHAYIMKTFKYLVILLFAIPSVYSAANRSNRVINLQQLQQRCLSHQNTATKDRTCTTPKKLRMQITNGVENGVFYCLTYKRDSGLDVYGYDTLTIQLHPDYDLQYSGANVIDYEFPSFKLYDVRVSDEYRGRFAIYSNNTSFKIYHVTINDEPQSCTYGKTRNQKKWPEEKEKEPESDYDDIETIPISVKISSTSSTTSSSTSPSTTSTTTSTTETPKMSTSSSTTTEAPTTLSYFTTTYTMEPSTIAASTENKIPEQTTSSMTLFSTSSISNEKFEEPVCGVPQKTVDFKQFHLPSNPGEFPFVVSIYHILDLDDLYGQSYYKCAGSILTKNMILTSANCLLDHNSKLIREDYLQIQVAQFLISAKRSNLNTFYDVEQVHPHENFNYNLNNNIAGIKLKRSVEFDNFVQPICMPETTMMLKDESIGKLAGFGKSNMLTEDEYTIYLEDKCKDNPSICSTFNGNNTGSGNVGFTDLGCGLFTNDSNRWVLIGITSKIPHRSTSKCDIEFTNVLFYIDWIKKTFS